MAASFIPVVETEPVEEGQVSVKALDATNPEWDKRSGAWEDIRILYEGGVELENNATRFLRMRVREDPSVYAARVERLTYQNILATAVGWYVAAMFKDSPEVLFHRVGKKGETVSGELDPSAQSFYLRFLKNCDKAGSSFVRFIVDTFIDVCLFGISYVLIDLPSAEVNPVTMEDERQLGLRDPYLVLFNPVNVLDWKNDREGNLVWIKAKFTSTERDDFLGKVETVDRWYYYDREKFSVYERRTREGETAPLFATNTSNGTHSLSKYNCVPVVRITFQKRLWLANRVYLALKDHLNQDNTLSWALFMSNLAMPVVITDDDVSELTQTEAGFIKLSSGSSYTWSEPEGKSNQQSASRLESLREEIFRSMYLQAQGRSMRATPAMQSGRSKELDMAPVRDVLCGMADVVVSAMQNCLAMVRDARNDSGYESDVRGPEFYEEMTTDEVFAFSASLQVKVPSDTFEREMYKKFVRSWMPDMNPEVRQKMDDEISSGPLLADRERKELMERAKIARENVSSAISKIPLKPGQGGGGRPAGKGSK